MAAFPHILCPNGQWTDISTGMLEGKAYTIQNLSDENFWLSETEETPAESDSRFFVRNRQFMLVTYASIPLWVQPVNGDSITIEIQEAQ